MGVETCGDLQQLPLEKLVERFGKYGRRLHDVARGVDKRRVQTSRVRKSISVERTYARDIDAMPAMVAAVDELLLRWWRRWTNCCSNWPGGSAGSRTAISPPNGW
jgi:DNA polymerase-4